MPFGIAEAIATISAAMQAIDLYSKHGGTRAQVIQTLNLEYHPDRYEHIERQVLDLGGEYARMFSAVNDKVADCIRGFTEAITDDQLPYERGKLGNSARACVCKQIKLVRDFMGPAIPDELARAWDRHKCDEYFINLSEERKTQVSLPKRQTVTSGS
jgi:hypothetical protein